MTPDGVLYEKEHIFECLLHQKKDIARKLKLWEEQEGKEADKAASEEHHAHEELVAKFHRDNHGAGMFIDHHEGDGGGGGGGNGGGGTFGDVGEGGERHVASSASVAATQSDKERMKSMKAFWLPSKTPTAERKAEKPDTDTKCPTTLKKLRLKAG